MLRALSGQSSPVPPIWLMRQAGRYLPEYLKTRADAGSFLELCYDSDRATEVTLQPIRRFGFDAAILFADILLVPHALGQKVWFEVGEGPRLEPLQSSEQVARLNELDLFHDNLAPVYETVRMIRAKLPATTALIGFAGAPWTVATYMIAGRGKDNQTGAKAMMKNDPLTFERLMHRLENATVEYLSKQIAAGADTVKLFDSWAGALAGDEPLFRRWCIEPAERIVARLRERHPDTPVIVFPRGADRLYGGYARSVGAACVAIDEAVSPEWARDVIQPVAAVQGNLDPHHLVGLGEGLEAAAERILETLSGGPFVFNLGHGITPDADPRNVERLVRFVRG